VPGKYNSIETHEIVPFPTLDREANASGVSWGAVAGGAFVASALSLILLALGAGFGLSTVSPWSHPGATGSIVGAAAIAWLIVTQVIASAMGGYLAGRLRTKWHATHGDEVHFRDTANGFLVWAVALVLTVAFLATEATHMAGSATVAGRSEGPAATSLTADATGYFVDRLFRSDRPAVQESDSPVRSEAARILAHSAMRGAAPAADQAYLAQLVAAKTGLTADAAERRVAEVLGDAWQSEEQARQATAHFLLWLFLALLTGAFCASLAATVGGRQRDRVLSV